MPYRFVSPVFVGSLVLLTAALAACSDGMVAPDNLAGRSSVTPSGAPANGTESSNEATDPEGPGSGGGSSNGSPAGADAGASGTGGDAGSKPPAADAFAGAGAFVATSGPSTSKGAHGNGGNPAKRACLTSGCHGGGGGGPLFAAGGSVFKDVAATMPAANVEVRLLDAAGNAVLTHTDALGNFFVRATTATAAGLAFPNKTAARDATTTKPMSATIANGNCNSTTCHGGTQGFIHVP